MPNDIHNAWCSCPRCQHPAPASTLAGRNMLFRLLVALVTAELAAILILLSPLFD